MEKDFIILGKDAVFTTDSTITGLNNNLIIIGASGAGKSRSIIEPNIINTNETNMIISDPKGRLVERYGDYLRQKGYHVYVLDFVDPTNSRVAYDPIRFITENTYALYNTNANVTLGQLAIKDSDIFSIANLIMRSDPSQFSPSSKIDPFWTDMSEVFLSAFIALIIRHYPTDNPASMVELAKLTDTYKYAGENASSTTKLDQFVCRLAEKDGGCYAVKQYKKVQQMPERTLACVYATVSSLLGRFASVELENLLQGDNILRPDWFVDEKAVLFIKTPDFDSSTHYIANLCYAQLMQSLLRLKDIPYNRNTRPIRFILDDFAASVVIRDMPQWISTMRERDISVMLVLQSIAQLNSMYGESDARTILSNCDTLVYLRSNDLVTAREFAERLDLQTRELLYSDTNTVYIMRPGMDPIKTTRYDIREHPEHQFVKYATHDTINEKMSTNKIQEVEKIALGFQVAK